MIRPNSPKGFNRSPWELRKQVLPQHTDHAGVMWHGAYLNWLEEARVKALTEVGLPYSDISSDGYEMPVVSLQIKYLAYLLHGDNVVINSWVQEREGLRWTWDSRLYKECGEIVAEAKVQLVLIKKEKSGNRLLRKLPEKISSAVDKLQKGPGN